MLREVVTLVAASCFILGLVASELTSLMTPAVDRSLATGVR